MTSGLKLAMAALLPVLLGGCQTVEDTETEIKMVEKPVITQALLTQKSAEAHEELEATVSRAMGGQKVTLSQETLVGQSTFSVQQKQHMGPDGNPIMGRIMKRPDKFTLYTDGSTCSLTHDESGDTYPLSSVVCERVTP